MLANFVLSHEKDHFHYYEKREEKESSVLYYSFAWDTKKKKMTNHSILVMDGNETLSFLPEKETRSVFKSLR